MEVVHHGFPANSVGSYLEDDGVGKHLKSEPAEACDLAHGFNLHSMADLVDNLQDKAYLVSKISRNVFPILLVGLSIYLLSFYCNDSFFQFGPVFAT